MGCGASAAPPPPAESDEVRRLRAEVEALRGGTRTGEPASPSPASVEAARLAEEMRGALNDWTLEVENAYREGSYNSFSKEGNIHLVSPMTSTGTGIGSGEGFIQATFAEMVHVEAVRVAPLDGWGPGHLKHAKLEVWVADGDSWSWQVVSACSGKDEKLAVGRTASMWRLSGDYCATSMFIFYGTRTGELAPCPSPASVAAARLAEEMRSSLNDWTLEVENAYHEAYSNCFSKEGNIHLVTPTTEKGSGTRGEGFIQATFAEMVHVESVRVAPLDGWGSGYLERAKLLAWVANGDSWEWEVVGTCSGSDEKLAVGRSASVWRLAGNYFSTSMLIFFGTRTGEPASPSPASVEAARLAEEMRGALNDWTLEVQNAYHEGYSNSFSEQGNIHLVTPTTKTGTGIGSGKGFIQATFEEMVHVETVRVAPLDGWGSGYLKGALLEMWDEDKWSIMGVCSGADEKIAVSRAGKVWRVSGDYKATSMLIFFGQRASGKGFSAVPVPQGSAEWGTLCELLKVTDPLDLGQGRDVKEIDLYNSIKPVLAWKLFSKSRKTLYDAARGMVSDDIDQISSCLALPKIQTKLDGGSDFFKCDTNANAKMLLHGTKPESLPTILRNGLSEKFSGGLLGKGIYLAEDAAKIDQYCTSDSGTALGDLYEVLYTNAGVEHPGTVFYAFACRAALGVPIYTKDGETDSLRPGESVFATEDKRELSVIPFSSPPVHYHTLIAETGSRRDGFILSRHREFVVFNANRVYEEYLIAYKREIDPSLPLPKRRQADLNEIAEEKARKG